MMALKPTEDGRVRGLLNMLSDKILSRELQIELYFPENLKELQLKRIYRCTQKISRFYKVIVRYLQKFSFTYYTSNINRSSISYKPGHEIVGELPELLLLPQCNCFGNCKLPLEHLLIANKVVIFALFKRLKLKIKNDKLTVIVHMNLESKKCVHWLKEELKKESIINYVIVKTLEECRGLEYPALVTIDHDSRYTVCSCKLFNQKFVTILYTSS